MTDFPIRPMPDDEIPDRAILVYLLKWAGAMNDWHLVVDARLKDLRWIKWGTIAGVGFAGLDLIVRVMGR